MDSCERRHSPGRSKAKGVTCHCYAHRSPGDKSKEADNRGLCNECFAILFQSRKEEADVGSAIQNILN